MTRLLFSSVALLSIIGAAMTTDSGRIDDRQQLWKQVDQQREKSKPRSAMETLDKIYASAMQDDAFPEAVRALATKYMLDGSINQPMIPHVIRQISADLDEMPTEVQPVMKTILASWFFSYYQQNRWRFAQRSQTAQPPSDDFETWDLPRLLNHIDSLFQQALADSESLQQIPIEQYDKLLSTGTVSDAHRPTLYDFIAFQALDFYSLDEQIIRKQGAFDLRADGPIFSPVDQFLTWDVSDQDPDSFLVRAVQLYQQLLQFHADDPDRTALLDANLHRLAFGHGSAVGSEKDARYKAALQTFADMHADHELSALALARLAGVLHGEDEWLQAHRIASQGNKRFPNSPGGRQCFNLIQQIEARELSVSTERIWNAAGPAIDVTYRNIERVHFRLVAFDYTNWRWGDYRFPENLQRDERNRVLRQKPIKEWSVDLPKTDDYQRRLEQLPVDVDMAAGCYLLIASHNEKFNEQDNVVSIAGVWVSDLAVVMRSTYGSTDVAGQVVHAITGEPIAGARVDVNAWVRDGRNSKPVPVGIVETDANGMFSVAGRHQRQHRILISHNGQQLGLIDRNYKYSRREKKTSTQTILFTDRKIYRPGQTIQFKGICVSSNSATNDYRTLANESVAVVFRDYNNQELARQTFKSNEFGSFSGSFIAPSGRATGQMRIQVEDRHIGNAWFNVEEYKRPKFYTEVELPDQEFRLNQSVKVTGKATAYTGSAIDGAKVAWRVVREVRYPQWWMWRCWYCPPVTGDAQEIAHGVANTDVNGAFEIEFEAIPDLAVDREGEPVFTFTVYADVTDTTGETRSDSNSVRIGYTSLQANLSCDDWQTTAKGVELELTASTLDGEGQEATGELKIYRLQEPERVHRQQLANRANRWMFVREDDEQPEPDLSQFTSWPLGEVAHQQQITTLGDGTAKPTVELEAGAYKAVFETADSSGNKVIAEKPFLVIDTAATKFAARIPHHFEAESWTVEPGDEFVAVWGSGYETARAFVEIEHRGQTIRSFWTDPGRTQVVIKQRVEEQHRGGFVIRVTFVQDNRAYVDTRVVKVPWTNKALQIKWERFESKLTPGSKESWSALITGLDSEKVAAEMVAAMYDASLDAFAPNSWPDSFRVFHTENSPTRLEFQNHVKTLRNLITNWRVDFQDGGVRYRYFDSSVAPAIGYGRFESRTRGFGGRGGGGGIVTLGAPMARNSIAADSAMPAPASAAPMTGTMAPEGDFAVDARQPARSELKQANNPNIDLSSVTARKNLQETAFFYPHLTTDENGAVRIEFEIPEALTQWKFLGFAHDTNLRSAMLTDEVVTSKDLMVQPNPPRFLREGDELEFSVKVTNQSATRQTGSVQLTFTDARTSDSMDEQLANSDNQRSFDIPAGQSKSLYWKLAVPDFVGVLTYKAVGATERLSDGEEGFLPVLSKRILVTESLPLPIRGKQTKTFTFDRLKNSGGSDTLQSQSLTVQMASNPAWYAVMALPYLMEYPHECSEQVFNRLYANSLARHIANSDPKINRVFEQWRGTDALDSPLEKNEELRNVLIAESPWLRDAKKESQARRDVAILFDQNRLDQETERALNRIREMQYSDGSWPWFPGGRANDYITLYVTTGFGRLRHLGVEVDVSVAVASLDRLDNWVNDIYREIVRQDSRNDNHLTPRICLYLYGRSFFLKDKPIDAKYKSAVDYFLSQGKRYWPKLGDRQSQGHLAIALKRFGDLETPREIMESLTERSVTDPEMGMLWREEPSWWWYRAPIETQAVMIEAYDEVLGDAEKVEECKVWLLKQKQTQNWKTTKATADACYALLLRGTNVLASDKLVEVKLGSTAIEPQDVEAGTGFYQQRFVRSEIEPEMGEVTATKSDEGVAWGSLHWQYLEDVGKIEPYEGTPLKLKKSLFIKRNTDKGPVIEPVTGPVSVGDELVTRIELRVDRDMEYVHLKDYRGSGTEPVNVLSRYRFQDSLAYYESTKDTASHFFIDYLRRGTYVFEYSVRVQHRGKYETGIAELQCMYAPEFNSHSGSVAIEVE